MAWVESHSLSFSARYDSDHTEEAAAVLAALEVLRDELGGLYEQIPDEVAVVLHPRPAALALAHPWLPLARRAAAPAARRYYAGWFSEFDIHVLAPPALEKRASGVPGSREALLLSPQHEYAHLVVGANNPYLPPPFSLSTFRRYVRWAWLCEGAAVWLSGQTPYLRPAIVRRLREDARPEFPPSARDAMLLGGTIFSMLEREAGPGAAAALATSPLEESGARGVIAEAFDRQVASAAAALAPCCSSSRPKTVPPSSIASRDSGGNAGRPPSRKRHTIAARSRGAWPDSQVAAPSHSQAQRT